MSFDVLFLVPSDGHVERLVLGGKRAETRASFERRLATTFVPEIVFCPRSTARIALAATLADEALVLGDAFDLGALRRKGGRSWPKTVDALDRALGTLYEAGVGLAELRAHRMAQDPASKIFFFACIMQSVEERLERAGICDERRRSSLLAAALREARPRAIAESVGASHVRTRWILSWTEASLRVLRALDDALSPLGLDARVVLPSFDRPLGASSERDPLEVLAEELARLLDAPVETEPLPAVFGHLSASMLFEGAVHPDADRLKLLRVDTALLQAEAAASLVYEALERGCAIERVAVAMPSLDEHALAPLRRAFEATGTPWHERGAPPSEGPLARVALAVLDNAEQLDREAVALVLGSGYVDARRLVPEGVPGSAARNALSRMVRRLEASATKAGGTAQERFVRTATTDLKGHRGGGEGDQDGGIDEALAVRIGELLSAPADAHTRAEYTSALRRAWLGLGLGAVSGKGALDTFSSDASPSGIRRAERLAIARDARAWELLVSTLDAYESAAERVGAAHAPIDRGTFRSEFVALLDASGSRGRAGRAGAVRVARIEDLAGEEHDLVVVLDANEGRLPRDDTRAAFVDTEVLEALGRTSPAMGQRIRDLALVALLGAEAKEIVLISTKEDSSGASVSPSPIWTALERQLVAHAATPSMRLRSDRAEVRLRADRERAREGFFLDPLRPTSDLVGRLALSETAKAIVTRATGGEERPLAVTSLERFARCPFMGYVTIVLGVREAQLQSELPDAREEGTLVHAALAAAFTETRAMWPRRPRDEAAIVDLGMRAAEKVLAEGVDHAPLRSIARLRVLGSVRAVLTAAIEDEAWDFDLAEQPFGDPSGASWAPLVMSEEGERLSLRGSIDRVDRSRDRQAVRVIDYKRSKSKVAQTARSVGETVLQVPLYACVAREATGASPTGQYLPFQPRDIRDAKVTDAAATRLGELIAVPPDGMPEIETRALHLVLQARRGELVPLPHAESECVYCTVSGACRKPRFAMDPDDDEELE